MNTKKPYVLPRGDAALGEILEGWRASAGYTQEDVAKLLGMARTSYNAIEQGIRSINTNELRQLAAIFQVSVSQLLEPHGQMPPPKPSSFWELLIDEARDLSMADRAMLLDFVRFLHTRGKKGAIE